MDDHKITAEQIDAYGRWLQHEERTPGTREKYLRDIRAFACWLEGGLVTKELAAGWKAHLVEAGYAPVTINSMLSAINGLFCFLGWEECRVKFLKVQRRLFRDESRDLTRPEYVRLLDTARGLGRERLALLMETICATGIRVSELKCITVEAVQTGRAEIANKGKRRTVFLPDKLRRLLRTYLQAQKKTAQTADAKNPVFTTRTGRPLDRSNIWRDMKRLCDSAGVEPGKVFPHNLRHLFARTYYTLEKDLSRLADILGHSSVNTTRVYTMESGAVHARQMERMGLVLTT